MCQNTEGAVQNDSIIGSENVLEYLLFFLNGFVQKIAHRSRNSFPSSSSPCSNILYDQTVSRAVSVGCAVYKSSIMI